MCISVFVWNILSRQRFIFRVILSPLPECSLCSVCPWSLGLFINPLAKQCFQRFIRSSSVCVDVNNIIGQSLDVLTREAPKQKQCNSLQSRNSIATPSDATSSQHLLLSLTKSHNERLHENKGNEGQQPQSIHHISALIVHRPYLEKTSRTTILHETTPAIETGTIVDDSRWIHAVYGCGGRRLRRWQQWQQPR